MSLRALGGLANSGARRAAAAVAMGGQLRDKLADMPAVTLYHYPCNDGVYAALASHLYHKQQGLPCRLLPLSVYREPSVEELQLQGDECVYFLDYTGPEGFALEVAKAAKQVVVLDHHKTAQAHMAESAARHPPNLSVNFDMERSGATIALDFFRPEGVSSDLQRAFKLIEDGDLWRWQLEGGKAFHAGLRALDLEFDATANPGIFDQLLALTTAQVVDLGTQEMERQDRLVEAALKRAAPVHLGGPGSEYGTCLGVVAGSQAEVHVRSQLGNSLAEASQQAGLQPVGAIAYEEPGMGAAAKGSYKVSLRSLGDWDTTRLSRALGGGGHANASSFIAPRALWHSWQAAAGAPQGEG